MMEHVEVAIVGAGLSGLAAARCLRSRGVESVLVLEGSPAAGGRAALPRMPGANGASPGRMFVRRTDRAVLDLAAELDVPAEAVEADRALDALRVDTDGEIALSEVNVPLGASWWTRMRNEWVLGRLVRLACGLDPVEPWRSANAEEFDAQTVRTWLRAHSADDDVLDLVEEQLTFDAGLPADRISMLWLLAHIGPEPDDYRTPFHLDPAALVGRLVAGGAAVRTGHDVARIEQEAGGARLSGPWGSLTADRVVVALTPADVQRIAFAPDLPPSRKRMQQQWPQAEVVRSDIVYWRPFWRNFGLSGEAVFDDGIPAWTFDDSPADASFGRLVAHTHTFGDADPMGADQSVIDDPARHRGHLLDNLRQTFGPLAAEPVAFLQAPVGPDPYSRAYQSPTPPGFLTEYGPLLRRPVGRIHWAATETASFPANGTLGGAVASGSRAAAEVLEARGARTGKP
ncbi:monoamine oxidase [Murinocardiopsis flavida]|uniref:Monoamine oxidase n=1 Tax=Murinocardiopsis flavida TaxID=645275 RepID=A0A2P8CRA2_9ACTN|nr:FAD-dependent oxidoreductase [Murinocardiopsis flavida]PSK87497.1 monoamine oxidase [Murinocardiopsis flavida]